MKESFVAKFEGKDASSNVIQLPEPEAHDDLGACGLLRGIHDRALMLELRFRDGSISACGYMWLDNAQYDPREGITLSFARRQVRISGQNLDAAIRPGIRLFEALTRHRVIWLREAESIQPSDTVAAAILIERIEMED